MATNQTTLNLGKRNQRARWKSGVHEGGIISSTWHSGISTGGDFADIVWNRGIKGGGIFSRGVWNSLDLSSTFDNNQSVWNRGAWYNIPDARLKSTVTEIFFSIWNGGTWNSGSEPFTWSGDLITWNIGTKSVILPEADSLFLGGVWNRGEWNGGIFFGSTWQSLNLGGGYDITQSVWNGGKFLRSVWHGGIWNYTDDLRASQFGDWIQQSNTLFNPVFITSGIVLNENDEIPEIEVPEINELSYFKFGKYLINPISPYDDTDYSTGLFSSIWLRGIWNGGIFKFSKWYSSIKNGANISSDITYPATVYNSTFNAGLFFGSIFNGGQVQGLTEAVTFNSSVWNIGHWRVLSGQTSTSIFQNSIWNSGIWEGGRAILSVFNSGVREYAVSSNRTISGDRDGFDAAAPAILSGEIPDYIRIPIPGALGDTVYTPANIINNQGDKTIGIKINSSDISSGKGDLFWANTSEWNTIVSWTSGTTQNLNRLLGEINSINNNNNMVLSGSTNTASRNIMLFTGQVDNRATIWLNGTAEGVVWNGGEWRNGTFTYYRVRGETTTSPSDLDWFGIEEGFDIDKIEPGVWTRGIWRGGTFGIDQPPVTTIVTGLPSVRYLYVNQPDNVANLKSIWMSIPAQNPNNTVYNGNQFVSVYDETARLGLNVEWTARQIYYDSGNIPAPSVAAQLPLPDKANNTLLTSSGNGSKIPNLQLLTGQFSSIFTRTNYYLAQIPIAGVTGNTIQVASAITLSYTPGITEVLVSTSGTTLVKTKYFVQGVTGNTFSVATTGFTNLVGVQVIEYRWSQFSGQFVNGIFDDSRRFNAGIEDSNLGYKVPYLSSNAIFGNVNNVFDQSYLPLDRIEFKQNGTRTILTWDPINGIESVFPANIKWDSTYKLNYEFSQPPTVGDEEDAEELGSFV